MWDDGIPAGADLYTESEMTGEIALASVPKAAWRNTGPVLFKIAAARMATDGHDFQKSDGVWQTQQIPPCYMEQLVGPHDRDVRGFGYVGSHPNESSPRIYRCLRCGFLTPDLSDGTELDQAIDNHECPEPT